VEGDEIKERERGVAGIFRQVWGGKITIQRERRGYLLEKESKKLVPLEFSKSLGFFGKKDGGRGGGGGRKGDRWDRQKGLGSKLYRQKAIGGENHLCEGHDFSVMIKGRREGGGGARSRSPQPKELGPNLTFGKAVG